MSAVRAHIALGANLGDRLATFRDAVRRLEEAGDTPVVALSALYETVPVGGPAGQESYYNAVLALTTALPPEALLDRLQAIEAAHQRTRTVYWGPRTLDLDLLLYGEDVVQTARLTVPHLHLHERRFVLRPLADIAADARDPRSGRTVADLLAALPAGDLGDVAPIMKDWR